MVLRKYEDETRFENVSDEVRGQNFAFTSSYQENSTLNLVTSIVDGLLGWAPIWVEVGWVQQVERILVDHIVEAKPKRRQVSTEKRRIQW